MINPGSKAAATEASSRAFHFTSSGIASAPILAVANMISRCSIRLPTDRATASPRFTPMDNKPLASLIHTRIQIRVTDLTKAILRRDLNRKFPSVPAQTVANQHCGIHFRFSILDFRL